MKSVNLNLDFARPEVLELYNPTQQSLDVVRRIIGQKGSVANHVVAPYGSGKSFSALVGKTLLSDLTQLKTLLQERLKSSSKELNGFGSIFRPNLVITLNGYCPNLSKLLCEKAGLALQDDISETLKNLQEHYKNYNHIAIIWDEFGHHLETLVREERQEDLLNVQFLAEWAVRRAKPTVSFLTLMHKTIGFYTRGASQEIIHTWKKIEGRFETIRLEISEFESFEIIADILQTNSRKSFRKIAEKVQSVGFFKSLNPDTIGNLLGRTYPLTPAALEILPRLGSRFAQNERTLHQFLKEIIIVSNRNDPVGLDVLYDYFANSLAEDVGPGGAYKAFVESETALSQAKNLAQQQIIKAITLLKLGSLSEKINLSKQKLLVALVEGSKLTYHTTSKEIESLIKSKLLLYRSHTDDVSIWYGVDFDLDNAIAEETTKLKPTLCIVDGLERLIPPEPYFSLEYNYKKSVTRYALTKYVTKAQLANCSWVQELEDKHKCEDTVVLLLLDCSLNKFDEKKFNIPVHWIIAIPHEGIDYTPTFLELCSIINLQERMELKENNHLLDKELGLLRAAAETSIRDKLEIILNPDRGKVSWYLNGKVYSLSGQTTSDRILANLFEKRYSKSPIIRNEQIIRRNVSGVSKSARKRCNLAVLERSGTAHLGYEGSTSFDASVYRTVIEKTGLYILGPNGWRWAEPKEVKDTNLKQVWSELQQFYCYPNKKPKPFSDITQKLSNPPYGIRAGLIPLLMAAGIKAFGRFIAIHEILDGKFRYLDDIQPSIIEEICHKPENYSLTVFPFTTTQLLNLQSLVESFNTAHDQREIDLIRAFYDNLIAWRSNLPPSAQEVQGIGDEGFILQKLLFRVNFDPLTFLSKDYPDAIGGRPLTKRSINKFLVGIKEIEGIIELNFNQAIEATTNVFNSKNPGADRSLLAAVDYWSQSIPTSTPVQNSWDYIAKGVYNRSKNALNFPDGEKGYISMLSVILLGRSPEEWNNSDLNAFQEKLLEVLNNIEMGILSSDESPAQLTPFIKNRIASIIDQFSTKIGLGNVKQLINEIYDERSH